MEERTKKDSEAQGATREKWGEEDAATLIVGWSGKGL